MADKAFADRHIGPRDHDLELMLGALGYSSMDAFLGDVVPEAIRIRDGLAVPDALDEAGLRRLMADLASTNRVVTSMIGMGYQNCHTPPVIRRNVIESPAWYTAYTPYQPEISQGRLEALLAFQTVVEDLTALPVAPASLLDEPTAAAEGMGLLHRTRDGHVFLVDADTHPQTIAVLSTRAAPIGIEIRVLDRSDLIAHFDSDVFGVLVSYPGSSGQIDDIRPILQAASQHDIGSVVATDLLSLTLLTPPGEMGADVCVGSAQRFGVPMGFGGPHAGFMSVRAGLERSLPGRLVGVSVDVEGRPAYRLALQTREQHIRRERATSNICTAQVLLAVVAAMYAAYHGPEGLREIATRVRGYALRLGLSLQHSGIEVLDSVYFDTVTARADGRADAWIAAALREGINIRRIDEDTIGVTLDETTTDDDLERLARALGVTLVSEVTDPATSGIPMDLQRTSPYLVHPTFHDYRSETEMLRHLRRLSDRDLALDRTMIPLGSCTMKLNATSEMEPITWPGFADIHPFAPLDQAAGYVRMINELESLLSEVTGYDAVSVQPNAGSQGEFAGLLAIRAYHHSRGEDGRTVCLIPSSAHGTNAASAVMAGMRVVVIACDEHGNVDVDDLRAKIATHGDELAALMITYPSTHGVFEEAVGEICAMVHDAGGQVYVDGANLNALVGLAKPGRFGADVSHLNLHKTFCIPHGGGGPGVGPIGVRAHLAPFLPTHPLRPEAGPEPAVVGPVSGAPWGSAGILPIPYAYLRLMGPDGLTKATSAAIVSANYIASRLGEAYPILYTGAHGRVAHECILDLRPLTKSSGITVDDVAKRLIDYGFHAPTMSFPVAGTLMVEPTESESRAELDRFCDAMIAIRDEIAKVESGEWPADDNPLRHAPHSAECLVGDWSHRYDRRTAAFPAGVDPASKYWPPVRRIDGAYGDRHLACSCPAPSALAEAPA
ncbi:MAG: aminomethyl-transferring glycine dehydrogenase [Candidatus Nanopelagicales bacterium]